jgi:hypothetical protein
VPALCPFCARVVPAHLCARAEMTFGFRAQTVDHRAVWTTIAQLLRRSVQLLTIRSHARRFKTAHRQSTPRARLTTLDCEGSVMRSFVFPYRG